MQRHSHIARALYDLTALHPERDALAHALATHPSDIARSWASQWLACTTQSLAEKLVAVRPFAADPHFGVREIAWMSVRNDVIAELENALVLLQPWVSDADANVRRFACELTRPRGVWCAQIELLKSQPWKAQALLEPLRADPSRYVQNSVANWLNDASKSQAQWVAKLCAGWMAQPQEAAARKATQYIVRRAQRTLAKD
jgi:3-methyladenine DNA glycosylase AlkC